MEEKTKILVMFGGVSPEHDVSILSALQAIHAIDSTKYEILPLYIDKDGDWWYGKELLFRHSYYLSDETKRSLNKVYLCVGGNKSFKLKTLRQSLFEKIKEFDFDMAFPIFHGTYGETGQIQGMLEAADIPYVGPRLLSSAITMNKKISKLLFKQADIPVLPEVTISRPRDGIIDAAQLLTDVKVPSYPVCVKPCNLGSSIGVSKANNKKELESAISDIFKMDSEAIIEPYIANLVEYNISVTKSLHGETSLSVIEKPLTERGILTFADKYITKGGKKGAKKFSAKIGNCLSGGMDSSARKIDPKELTTKQKKIITESAKKAFELLDGTGVWRVDFLCNSKTGDLWLCEANPIPGSLSFYLWNASKPKVTFTDLLEGLIQEGFEEYKSSKQNTIDSRITKSGIFREKF